VVKGQGLMSHFQLEFKFARRFSAIFFGCQHSYLFSSSAKSMYMTNVLGKPSSNWLKNNRKKPAVLGCLKCFKTTETLSEVAIV
jgi:hypothetical protein